MTLENAIKSISEKRLRTYKKRMKISSDEECFGTYFLWNANLCAEFLPVLQLLEISLRNSVHEGYLNHHRRRMVSKGIPQQEIDAMLDRSWFQTFFELNQKRYPESYRHISSAQDALKKQNRNHLDIDEIIGKLPFGFWANLCGTSHAVSVADSLRLWPALKADVFPGARGVRMNDIQCALRQVNHIRNRIAHHEPIWHASDLYDKEAIINKLLDDFAMCLYLIDWINPSNMKTVALMESDARFAGLCSLQAINDAMKRGAQFDATKAIDPKAWKASCAVNGRHNGVVIQTGKITVIKSLKDKEFFFLDTRWPHDAQTKLEFSKDELVNFIPTRTEDRNGNEKLFARATERGHI